ncbi:MAG: carboxypeptidase-like regulatory domain-containing protein, partial [Candidatus Zixiibacteriota bacterium]
TGHMHGYIYFFDRKNSALIDIERAEVKVAGLTAVTDSNGLYSFNEVPYGIHEIVCSYPQYDTAFDMIEVNSPYKQHNMYLYPYIASVSGHIRKTYGRPVPNALVLLYGRITTSDINGYYHLDSIEYGVHELICYNTKYDSFYTNAEVSQSHIVFDINLNQSPGKYVDTIIINGDATIIHTIGNEEASDFTNYGVDNWLKMGRKLWQESIVDSISGETTYNYYNQISRFLLYLPNINDYAYDSVFLSLKSNRPYDLPDTLLFRINYIIDGWNENRVTWNSCPEFDSTIIEYKVFGVDIPTLNRVLWLMNISDYYTQDDFKNGFMIRSSFETESYNYMCYFYSSDPKNYLISPAVVVYYTVD